MRVRKLEREQYNIVNVILNAVAQGMSTQEICKKFSGVTAQDVERIVRRAQESKN